MGQLHCKNCSKEVHPGRGDYCLVRIDAVADPQPTRHHRGGPRRYVGAEMST